MKKIIFCLTLLLSMVNAFAQPTAIPSTPSSDALENQAVYITQDLKIIPETKQESHEEQHYAIRVTYPQIVGERLSANIMQFNEAIKDLVGQEVQRFKNYVINDIPHMKTLPESVRNNSFRLDYDIDVVKPNDKTLVSVRLSTEGFQAGRAHPYHNHRVLNFDLSTGKEITLEELFKPKAKYLKFFSEFCGKKLNEKLEDKDFIEEGTKPVAKNYRNWNLEKDSILITFDEYQVAPYSYGPQEVEIPYEALKEMISPEATVYACVKHVEVCSTL